MRAATILKDRRMHVLLVIVAISCLYHFLVPLDFVAPTEWDRESAAGVKALNNRQFEIAAVHFNNALAMSEQMAAGDTRRGTSFHNLANLHRVQRRYTEAENYYRKALENLESAMPKTLVETGVVLRELASVYLATSRFNEARDHMTRSLEMYKQRFGEDSARLAPIYRDLGVVLLSCGEMQASLTAVARADELERNVAAK